MFQTWIHVQAKHKRCVWGDHVSNEARNRKNPKLTGLPACSNQQDPYLWGYCIKTRAFKENTRYQHQTSIRSYMYSYISSRAEGYCRKYLYIIKCPLGYSWQSKFYPCWQPLIQFDVFLICNANLGWILFHMLVWSRIIACVYDSNISPGNMITLIALKNKAFATRRVLLNYRCL